MNFGLSVLLTLSAISVQAAVGQVAGKNTIDVSPQEPALYELKALFNRADAVVLAKIVAGSIEDYDAVVYKAEVVTGFKGLKTGEIIYFGPYLGHRLGNEYVLFLLDQHKTLRPNNKAGYGEVRYWEVFDEGYSSMETSYECVFPGKKPVESCGNAVRVCTDYIKLPKSTPAFPPEENDPPFGCRWVAQGLFTSLLEDYSGSKLPFILAD